MDADAALAANYFGGLEIHCDRVSCTSDTMLTSETPRAR
jgi:hypothetical protein